MKVLQMPNNNMIIPDAFRRKIIWTLFLFCGSIAIHLLSLRSEWIDNQYCKKIYPVFAESLRGLTEFFGFSVGDLLYGIAALGLVFSLFKLLRRIKKEKNNLILITTGLILNGLNWVLSVYIVFNLFWGLNYNRKGIASEMGLDSLHYNANDLHVLNSLLLEKTNQSKRQLDSVKQNEISDIDVLGSMSEKSYGTLSKTYPFLLFKNPSLKQSLWGIGGSYMGISGYYNPFTGEAQVNMSIPDFLLPFTASHEVAHQMGYAKENEANFIGYLAATASEDNRMKYAAYFEMFLYANRNLFELDSIAARQYRSSLSEGVQKDIRTLIRFSIEHENAIEPYVTKLYSLFLKQNEQPQGILTYDQVNGLLIAYYKKYRRI